MKAKIVSCVGLVAAAASVCLAQKPSPTSASNWQLGPPFEIKPQQYSSTPAASTSPAPASTATAAIVQTSPTQSSEAAPAQPTRGRESSSRDRKSTRLNSSHT